MGQAVLVQHGFQRIDFGGNIHANILQKGIVQLFICRIQGVQDKFGHSGPAWEVLRDYGLTADAIADAVRSFVKEDQ